jgi:hypothetical protein
VPFRSTSSSRRRELRPNPPTAVSSLRRSYERLPSRARRVRVRGRSVRAPRAEPAAKPDGFALAPLDENPQWNRPMTDAPSRSLPSRVFDVSPQEIWATRELRIFVWDSVRKSKSRARQRVRDWYGFAESDTRENNARMTPACAGIPRRARPEVFAPRPAAAGCGNKAAVGSEVGRVGSRSRARSHRGALVVREATPPASSSRASGTRKQRSRGAATAVESTRAHASCPPSRRSRRSTPAARL